MHFWSDHIIEVAQLYFVIKKVAYTGVEGNVHTLDCMVHMIDQTCRVMDYSR